MIVNNVSFIVNLAIKVTKNYGAANVNPSKVMTFPLVEGRKRIITIYSIDNQSNTYTNKYVLSLICISGKDSFLYIGNHRKINELYPLKRKNGKSIYDYEKKLLPVNSL